MENFYRWLVRKLPKKLIYFATIQLMVEVTTGKYSETVVPELTLMDGIERFEKLNKNK